MSDEIEAGESALRVLALEPRGAYPRDGFIAAGIAGGSSPTGSRIWFSTRFAVKRLRRL